MERQVARRIHFPRQRSMCDDLYAQIVTYRRFSTVRPSRYTVSYRGRFIIDRERLARSAPPIPITDFRAERQGGNRRSIEPNKC